MSAELTFVDTNILFYAHDAAAGRKGEIAAQRLRQLWVEDAGVLSVQVLQEFFVNAVKKLPPVGALARAREVVRAYGVWVREPTTTATVLRATEVMELAQLSFWDSLIVSAAEQAGARILLSEDLNPGQSIAGVSVVNPFLDE